MEGFTRVLPLGPVHFLFGPAGQGAPLGNPNLFQPIFDPAAIVPYRGLCAPPSMCFCLHSLTNGSIAWVLS